VSARPGARPGRSSLRSQTCLDRRCRCATTDRSLRRDRSWCSVTVECGSLAISIPTTGCVDRSPPVRASTFSPPPDLLRRVCPSCTGASQASCTGSSKGTTQHRRPQPPPSNASSPTFAPACDRDEAATASRAQSSTASAQASDCRLAGPSAIDRQGRSSSSTRRSDSSATDRRGCFSGRNSEQDSAVARPERPRSAYASAGTGRRGSQMLPCGVRAAEALGDACLRPAGGTVRIVDRATPRGHGLSFPRGRHVRIGRRRSARRARVRRGVRRSGSRSGSRS
jgi:hypothetical protein